MLSLFLCLITQAQHFPLFGHVFLGQAHSVTLGQFTSETILSFYLQFAQEQA
jgi:hypothetical protein